jgi:hypothetical protein
MGKGVDPNVTQGGCNLREHLTSTSYLVDDKISINLRVLAV